jgi:transcriptional regulator with XRE-family HTH domain
MYVEIAKNFAQARKAAGLTTKALAEKLGVDNTTICNWESGRRLPTLERLTDIAEALNVSTAFLLGVETKLDYLQPIEISALSVLHNMPVWTKSYGWALVNTLDKTFVFVDKSSISYMNLQEKIYMIPPVCAISLRGLDEPLSIDEVLSMELVWVEPVTPDQTLASELRGWYRPHDRRLVENEFGNRFYLDTYGSKWLAFESCLDGTDEMKQT